MWQLIALLFAVSQLNLCEGQGPSAVTPVFVQKGGEVLLNVNADVSEDFILVDWKFNKTEILVRFLFGREPIPSTAYIGRLEFPEERFSVKLKNLQVADSGVYTARELGSDRDHILTEYNITVQDPVSPVKLTVDSVRSSDSCNLTVTCRTQDSHINSTFRCDNQTCSQEGGTRSVVTTSGASLQLYLANSSILCNHSNEISRATDIKIIEHLCLQTADHNIATAGVHVTAIAVSVPIFIVAIIAVLFGFYIYRRKRGNYDREGIDNTVYDTPQIVPTPQPQDQSPTEDDSGFSPTSTYCLVGPHAPSMQPNENRGVTQPESLYAQVEKPGRSLNT